MNKYTNYRITRSEDDIEHYGRKGMKWGESIFGKVNSAVNKGRQLYERANTAVGQVKSYRDREAAAKRDLLKQITRDSIRKDRAYGDNNRRDADYSLWGETTNRVFRNHDGAERLRSEINRASQVFGKDSKWGSVDYKESMAYKVDRGKREVNEFVKSFTGKSIFDKSFSTTADYGKDFMLSNKVTYGILDNPYLYYEE